MTSSLLTSLHAPYTPKQYACEWTGTRCYVYHTCRPIRRSVATTKRQESLTVLQHAVFFVAWDGMGCHLLDNELVVAVENHLRLPENSVHPMHVGMAAGVLAARGILRIDEEGHLWSTSKGEGCLD